MAKQETLVLIKPDAVERNIIGKIITIYEENGLKVQRIRHVRPIKPLAQEHYIEHKNKPFFPDLITYITRNHVVALVIEGDNAIERVRELNGSTNPNEAKEGTIRNLYALSKNENSVHASDSVESAKREIALWFPS